MCQKIVFFAMQEGGEVQEVQIYFSDLFETSVSGGKRFSNTGLSVWRDRADRDRATIAQNPLARSRNRSRNENTVIPG